MASTTMSYAAAGVSLEANDQVVQLIKRPMRRTYGPRVLGRHGAFAGCFRLDYNEKLFRRNYVDPVLLSCTDGVGSKVKLAAKLAGHSTIGQDVVAMNVNDLVVHGAEPLFFLDYIGIHKVDPPIVAQIVTGVAEACQEAGCALLGGETAELADVYRRGEFDLVGFAVGVCELRRLIDGTKAEPGDVLLGLASSGVHSNGYSLVRRVLRRAKLDLQRTYRDLETNRTLGEVLLTPTRIYSRSIVSLLRKYRVKRPVKAMSHITGGGLPGNLARVLGSHLNARIERGRWQVPPVFSFLQRRGRIDEEEMLRVFNMGIGYVCVVRPHFADSIAHQLKRCGENVMVLGKITRGTGRVHFA